MMETCTHLSNVLCSRGNDAGRNNLLPRFVPRRAYVSTCCCNFSRADFFCVLKMLSSSKKREKELSKPWQSSHRRSRRKFEPTNQRKKKKRLENELAIFHFPFDFFVEKKSILSSFNWKTIRIVKCCLTLIEATTVVAKEANPATSVACYEKIQFKIVMEKFALVAVLFVSASSERFFNSAFQPDNELLSHWHRQQDKHRSTVKRSVWTEIGNSPRLRWIHHSLFLVRVWHFWFFFFRLV